MDDPEAKRIKQTRAQTPALPTFEVSTLWRSFRWEMATDNIDQKPKKSVMVVFVISL